MTQEAKEDICFNCSKWGGKNTRAKPKPKCKVSSTLDSCPDFAHRFKKNNLKVGSKED